MRRLRRAGHVGLLLLLAAIASPAARADGLSAYVEPDYSHTVLRTTDQTGRSSSSTIDEFAQHYRLTLDQQLYPFVRLRSLGLFEKVLDWTQDDTGASRSDQLRTSGSAHLLLGPPILNGDLGYDRRDETSGSSTTSDRPHLVNEIYSFHAGWRPADLPRLELRLSRTNTFDAARQVEDTTVDEALLSASYDGIRKLDLRYSLHWLDPTDHLTGTSTSELVNIARASYGDTFNASRTTVSGTYAIQNRVLDTSVLRAGGTVATQQFPAAGLSLIEAFPALPETDTLSANPALVDGNTTAGAAVNIGFTPTLGGDANPRDLGLQFADPSTRVNTLYVWVDRQLPSAIASVYAWTAYQSDDNVTWTQVTVTAPVVFNLFQNRFEIAIAATQARYLKVVTKPLPGAVTADRRFADVFVTELQAYLTVPAESARGRTSTTTHTVNGALRHLLLTDPSLAYDFSGLLTAEGGRTSYVVVNGLSLDRRLTRALVLTARGARQDVGQEGQHLGLFQYSASLAAKPLPTLSHTLTYNGQYGQTPRGTSETNSLTLINHAALYRGIDAVASLGYSYNHPETGGTAQGPSVIVTASFAPHPAMSFSTSYFYSSTQVTGAREPDVTRETERVDGNLSFSPVPALYVGGSVSRVIKGERPTTLAAFGGNFSPFPGGDLLFRLSYSETLDSASAAKSQTAVAGVHWNIRSGTFLDVNYTLLDSTADVFRSSSRAFTVSLVIQL